MPKKTPTKKSKSKPKKVAKKPKPAPKLAKYFEAVGRRKTSVARVRLQPTNRPSYTQGEKTFLVNKKPLEVYFPTAELQQVATAPLATMKCLDKFKISAIVKGGGLSSQSQALSHGIARALVLSNPDFRKRLKKAGFLTRDPRMRERKKFGLKRARRAPQWQKR
jgi:small subunit ribosomal protein S9